MDKRIKEKLTGHPVTKIYRYVNDFLVILEDIPSDQWNQVTSNIIEVFTASSGGLRFTHELPRDEKIVFRSTFKFF